MPLIDFAPGLQALGKMFEDQGKMELDLFERQKKMQEENKLLKFNSLLTNAFSNVSDEKDLLEKTNLLTAYANENGILDKVSNNISLVANSKSKQLQFAKEDKILDDVIKEEMNNGGFREYNGKILHSKDIISNMLSEGLDKKVIIQNFKELAPANLMQSLNYLGGKYIYSENMKTKGAESEGTNREIIYKNGKILWADNKQEVTSPYIRDMFDKERDKVIEDYERKIMAKNNNQTNKSQEELAEGIQMPYSEGVIQDSYIGAMDLLQRRVSDKNNWTLYDRENKFSYEDFEEKSWGIFGGSFNQGTLSEEVSDEYLMQRKYQSGEGINQMFGNLEVIGKDYFLLRKIGEKKEKIPFGQIINELSNYTWNGEKFLEEEKLFNKYKIRETEKEMFRKFAFVRRGKEALLKDKNPINPKNL